MIAKQLIDQIKELSSNVSRRELNSKYFQALELLSPEDLLIIRDSYLAEAEVAVMPNLDHLY
jgi:hypothetical protein